jgi:NTE family protein
LRTLQEAGVTVDAVAGTSIGSCIAATLGAGYDPDEIVTALDELGPLVWRPTVPVSGLISTRKFAQGLQRLCGDRVIEELEIPVGIVATDIAEQREVVFKRGLIWPALLASVSIPGVFPALRMGSFTLVDGGVVNPVPSDVVAGLGADIVIGVKIAARPDPDAVESASLPGSGGSLPLVEVITRSIELMQSRITAASAAAATVQIDIDTSVAPDPGLRNFKAGRRFVAVGEEAARAALPHIAAVLPWVEGSARSI